VHARVLEPQVPGPGQAFDQLAAIRIFPPAPAEKPRKRKKDVSLRINDKTVNWISVSMEMPDIHASFPVSAR
jgi:hypothetical protein